MNTNRILALFLSLVLVLTLAACGSATPPGSDSSASAGSGASVSAPESTPAVTGTVILDGPDRSYSGAVTLEGDAPTASQAFIAFCQQENLDYQYKDGFFSGFAGIESTKTDGWLFYIGDDLAELGADSITLEDGFSISFRWKNYDQAFAK